MNVDNAKALDTHYFREGDWDEETLKTDYYKYKVQVKGKYFKSAIE